MHSRKSLWLYLILGFSLLSLFPFSNAYALLGNESFSTLESAQIFSTAKTLEKTKLAKISNLSNADKIRLQKAELRLVNALKSYDTAKATKQETVIQKNKVSLRSAASFFRFTVNSLKNSAINSNTSVNTDTSGSTTSTSVNSSNSPEENVSVLYYADSFNGANTSLGDVFSQWTFSAAKCSSPLSSLYEVRSGGKSVVIKVNDRPNCDKHPDIVDLSKVAFESLAPISRGKLTGTTHSLGTVAKEYKKNYLDMATFSSLGITLNEKIPNTYRPWETIHVDAFVTNGNATAVFFAQTPSGKKISLSTQSENGKVSFNYPLNEVGKYSIILSSGMGFSTTKSATIFVLPEDVYTAKNLNTNTDSLSAISNVSFTREESLDFTAVNIFTAPKDGNYRETTVKISANGKTIQRSSMGNVAFLSSDFSGMTSDQVAITVQSARSTTPFSLDVYETPKTLYSGTIPLVNSYKNDSKEVGNITQTWNGIHLTLTTPNSSLLRNKIYLIAPNGGVIEKEFSSQYVGSNGYLLPGKEISVDIPLSEKGQYILEVMYTTGFAAFNRPFSWGTSVASVLPNEYDSASKDADVAIAETTQHALTKINALRTKLGLSTLVIDTTLSKIALYKANDMSNNNYVGHTDSYGQNILGTAKRAGFSIVGSIGENVAGGTVSSDFLLAGLALSGGHRANMIDPDWTKLWVGVIEKNGMLYLVQVFGE